MQIIIISPNSQFHKHWHLTRSKITLMIGLALTLFLTLSMLAINGFSYPLEQQTVIRYLSSTSTSKATVDQTTTIASESEINDIYAKRLGELQAEAIRLKALTEKLALMAGLETSEYMLTEQPAQGGIEQLGAKLTKKEFQYNSLQLEHEFIEQNELLADLQNYLITNDSIESAIPIGRPVSEGWISSYFGNRIDPFNGKKTFHKGLDFAGKAGSNVHAVAEGLVTWIGKRGGYGGLVEVDHGNGYVTRYAHNKTITVKVGDKVSKGQVVALMGSTGRSTGPHLHFEVLRDGKHINPYNFVKR